MTVMVFDFETTGMIDFRAEMSADHQPHAVQFAGVLVEDSGAGRVVMSQNFLIKPCGWIVPDDASGVHGWTTDHCDRFGINRIGAFNLIKWMVDKSDMLVAHNMDFDVAIANLNGLRANVGEIIPAGKPKRCTMRAATPLCKIPKAKPRPGDPYKWPRLSEALNILCSESLTSAHDALADVMGCLTLYRKLRFLVDGWC
jgi:DNA polymerase III epsilon subunit-like protein